MPESPGQLPSAPISVVCDRCRAEGLAGDDPFEAFGDLLDFDPVPRRNARADGWSAEVQRAYIAALSLTGSIRQAARAVGKAQFGVDQLLRAPGSESFRAAHEEAMAIAADDRSRRLREGLAAAGAEASAARRREQQAWANAATRRGPGRPPSRPSALPSPVDDPEEPIDDSPEGILAVLEPIFAKYMIKLSQEREARLQGRIVEADFYLRQITWLEVAMDLGSGDGLAFLMKMRIGGRHPGDIAETPMSWLLGQLRRREWARSGDPERPEHPPADRLVDHGNFSTEPLEYFRGGDPASHDEQRRLFAERHVEAARAQLEWEQRARDEAAAWRARLEAEGVDVTPVPHEAYMGPPGDEEGEA